MQLFLSEQIADVFVESDFSKWYGIVVLFDHFGCALLRIEVELIVMVVVVGWVIIVWLHLHHNYTHLSKNLSNRKYLHFTNPP